MRILLWHGYLLRGSGSNVYTANIARTWRSQGHDVLLLCQEDDVTGLDFVDEFGSFDDADQTFSIRPTGIPSGPGRCRVLTPSIAGLLPVYIYDEYPGFEVKTFPDLTDEELERYTRLNVAALNVAIDEFRPEAFITGHEVMGPYIAREATAGRDLGYVAKLHGSALEWAVKKQERYRRFAAQGLGAARWVAGGSAYMVREASAYVPGWEDKAVVVNPGCDTDLFLPRPRSDGPPLVGYVGKLMEPKGVHNLLAAIPLMDVADLHCTVVGYGGFERGLHELRDALVAGDLDRARAVAARGEHGDALPELAQFLGSSDASGDYLQRASGSQIRFAGRLEHGPLAGVLPTFDVLCVPSVTNEAFGMVAAEAASCGVLPVVPDHSGIGEVGRTLEQELGCDGLLVFDHTDPIRSMAARLEAVLTLPEARRKELEAGAAELARARWSWSHVADRLRELASS